MDGHISWIREADGVADELSGEAKRQPEYRDADTACKRDSD